MASPDASVWLTSSNAQQSPRVEYFVSLMMQRIYRIVSSIAIFFILVYAGLVIWTRPKMQFRGREPSTRSGAT